MLPGWSPVWTKRGKIELTYLNEPFTVDHPSYPERLLRKGEWEKVRLKVKEGLPPASEVRSASCFRKCLIIISRWTPIRMVPVY